MKQDHRLIFAVGLLTLSAVLYSGFLAWSNKQTTLAENTAIVSSADEQTGQLPQLESLPAATGSIDNLTKAIETDANNQEALLQSQESEADAVTSDASAMEGFGGVYNEDDY
ncbi:MAG: hypothetical protein M1275_01075 [Patescibacteria group bacterium]|nr:hypothetical protein [Patescibacteria group bacterium]